MREDAAADTATALDEGTPLVWPELGTNRAFLYELGDKTKTEAAFAKAAQVVAHQVRQQPAGLQLHGAALGDRRVERRTRTASC